MRLRIPLGLFLVLLFVGGLSGQPPEPPPPVPAYPSVPAGAEVLGKGPVHEAYARPVDDRPTPSPLIPNEPPAAVEELPPDERPEGSSWIPGYWHFDDERNDFLWISGFWRVPPPNRQWIPGQFQREETGWRWVPGFWAAVQQKDLTYLPPPPPSLESGPSTPAPQEDALYIPGSWVYQETGYRWRGGFWTAYRPGWVWSPAQYYWTPAGYVFVDGYWDVPLERRGCLFAPVVLPRPMLRPGFVWTPTYVVTHDFLPSALFVRPSCGHYYFGDYYAPRYQSQGFSFWFDFRFGRSVPDPLYVYYRQEHRGRDWEREIRDVYVSRQRGLLPPPPPTLTAQLTPRPQGGPQILPPVVPRPVPAPLAPLSPRTVPPGLQLAKVAPPEREAIVRKAADLQALAAQRSRMEKQQARSGPPRSHEPPRTVAINLPAPPPPVPPAVAGTTAPRTSPPLTGKDSPPVQRGNPPATAPSGPRIVNGPAASLPAIPGGGLPGGPPQVSGPGANSGSKATGKPEATPPRPESKPRPGGTGMPAVVSNPVPSQLTPLKTPPVTPPPPQTQATGNLPLPSGGRRPEPMIFSGPTIWPVPTPLPPQKFSGTTYPAIPSGARPGGPVGPAPGPTPSGTNRITPPPATPPLANPSRLSGGLSVPMLPSPPVFNRPISPAPATSPRPGTAGTPSKGYPSIRDGSGGVRPSGMGQRPR